MPSPAARRRVAAAALRSTQAQSDRLRCMGESGAEGESGQPPWSMSQSSSRLMVAHCASMSRGRLGSLGTLLLPSAFTVGLGRIRSIIAMTLVATARCSACRARGKG